MNELFPHQREGLRRLLEYKGGGYGLFYAPGGGKSRTVISYLDETSPAKSLITAPAFVRKTWQREFKLWGQKERSICLLSSGKDVEEARVAEVVITSYELLKHIDWPFDVTVWDEAHYLAQEKSQRSQHARRISNLSENTFVIALTGSPVPQSPIDLHNLLDTMNPGMFGTYWQFVRRYCNEEPCEWAPSGKKWVGLKKENAAELMRRLDQVAHRVPFDEFAQHVPRMRMQPIYIKGSRLKKGFSWDDPNCWEDLLSMNSSAKIDAVVEKTEESMRGGVNKFCWGVWLHQTAHELEGRMKALGLNTYIVNGETPSDQRQAIMDAWANDSRPAALMAGIAAVGVGVNELVAAQVAGCVEVPWRVADLDQFMKRFERLNSTFSTMFYFFLVEGGRDERAANAYLNRKEDINMVIRPGEDDKATVNALKREQSDEDILASLL